MTPIWLTITLASLGAAGFIYNIRAKRKLLHELWFQRGTVNVLWRAHQEAQGIDFVGTWADRVRENR